MPRKRRRLHCRHCGSQPAHGRLTSLRGLCPSCGAELLAAHDRDAAVPGSPTWRAEHAACLDGMARYLAARREREYREIFGIS